MSDRTIVEAARGWMFIVDIVETELERRGIPRPGFDPPPARPRRRKAVRR